MPMLKLGFALEGNSDYPVIPCLARRVVLGHAFQRRRWPRCLCCAPANAGMA